MKIRGQKKTDIGTVRETNEDSCTLRWFRHVEGIDTPVVLGAVADGLGGLEKGEFASNMAISMCEKWFREDILPVIKQRPGDDKIKDSFVTLVKNINENIKKEAEEKGFRAGTTLSLILIFEYRYYCLSIGDSRVYRLSREDGLIRITDDDSWMQQELDRMPEDVRNDDEKKRKYIRQREGDKRRNALTQCLGIEKEIIPHFYTDTIESICWFLLCSDGFWGRMPEKVFLDIMDEDECMGLDCDTILNSRITFKKNVICDTDNITAVLIKVYDEVTAKLEGGDD